MQSPSVKIRYSADVSTIARLRIRHLRKPMSSCQTWRMLRPHALRARSMHWRVSSPEPSSAMTIFEAAVGLARVTREYALEVARPVVSREDHAGRGHGASFERSWVDGVHAADYACGLFRRRYGFMSEIGRVAPA